MRLRLEDGSVVITENAKAEWDEGTFFDGSNRISVATKSPWNHETLYQSRKGRYYLVRTSDYRECQPSAEVLGPQDAAAWILHMGHELPSDLQEYADVVSE